MSTRYLVRAGEAESYRPANHTGTENRRLSGPGVTVGSSIEVVHGTIQTEHGVSRHVHPGIEQVCYLLSGQAAVEIDDESFDMTAGDCCCFPAGSLHSFKSTGPTPAEVLIIYAPPYGEDPDKVVNAGEDGQRRV